ncbi:hypothetical protein [Ponticaulis sp.]|nr:hypothetical protein [Ponticaulis sp.]
MDTTTALKPHAPEIAGDEANSFVTFRMSGILYETCARNGERLPPFHMVY